MQPQKLQPLPHDTNDDKESTAITQGVSGIVWLKLLFGGVFRCRNGNDSPRFFGYSHSLAVQQFFDYFCSLLGFRVNQSNFADVNGDIQPRFCFIWIGFVVWKHPVHRVILGEGEGVKRGACVWPMHLFIIRLHSTFVFGVPQVL